jgi:hypothetical protein
MNATLLSWSCYPATHPAILLSFLLKPLLSCYHDPAIIECCVVFAQWIFKVVRQVYDAFAHSQLYYGRRHGWDL